MAALTNYNYDTDYAEFSIDSAEEVALLPTTTSSGSGVLANVGPIKAGTAYTTDGVFDIYTLASNEWNKVS